MTAIFDKFDNLRPKKPLVTCIVCFILFLCGLTMCLEGGVYMFELFVWYSSGISLITVGLLEVIVVSYVFGKITKFSYMCILLYNVLITLISNKMP